MTISVTLLGLTLGAVFFAYFTFSETNNANVHDATTMEFATIVSGNQIYFKNNMQLRVCLFVFFFFQNVMVFICLIRSLCFCFVSHEQVFRHGERTPNGLYPNDPHRNFSWIGGFGALTLVHSKLAVIVK